MLDGDGGNIEHGSWRAVVAEYSPLVRKLYVVLGNHELYSNRRMDAETLVSKARDTAEEFKNVKALHRDVAVTREGVDILACVLWCNPMRAVPMARSPMR